MTQSRPAPQADPQRLATAILLILTIMGLQLPAFLERADAHAHEHGDGSHVLVVDSHDHRHETAHLEAAETCRHHAHACVACAKQLTSNADFGTFSDAYQLASASVLPTGLSAPQEQILDLTRAPRGPPALLS